MKRVREITAIVPKVAIFILVRTIAKENYIDLATKKRQPTEASDEGEIKTKRINDDKRQPMETSDEGEIETKRINDDTVNQKFKKPATAICRERRIL